MKNIHIVFLFIFAALVGYHMCNSESFEGFAAIDDARQAVREIYNADIDAIRNLSTVATKLQAGGLTHPGHLRIQGTTFTSGDVVMNGGNNWLFHTPDDNRRTMYVAPSKAYGNEDWNWGASTEFNPDGSVNVKGNMNVKGRDILGELTNLQNQINELKGQVVRYDDKINITNRGTGNHENHGRYIGFCGSGGGGCGMVNVMLSGNKGISTLRIERN